MCRTKMLKNQKSHAVIQNESFVGFSMSHLHTGFGLWSKNKNAGFLPEMFTLVEIIFIRW